MNVEHTTPAGQSRSRYLIAAVLVAIGIAGGGWLIGQAFTSGANAVQHATVLPTARPLASFELLDHDAQPFTRDNLRGSWTLLFFGFTHCPDICPATLQQLALTRQRLAENGVGELPEIVLISVDPERDRPDVLANYVAYFGEGVTGITGDEAELDKLASPLGIYFAALPPTSAGSGYAVDHSTAVLLTNPDAELQAVFSTPHSIDGFVNDLPVIMAQR